MKTNRILAALFFAVPVFLGACSDGSDNDETLSTQAKKEIVEQLITEYNPEIRYEVDDYDSMSYEDLLQLEAKLAQLSGKENKHIVDSYK